MKKKKNIGIAKYIKNKRERQREKNKEKKKLFQITVLQFW